MEDWLNGQISPSLNIVKTKTKDVTSSQDRVKEEIRIILILRTVMSIDFQKYLQRFDFCSDKV